MLICQYIKYLSYTIVKKLQKNPNKKIYNIFVQTISGMRRHPVQLTLLLLCLSTIITSKSPIKKLTSTLSQLYRKFPSSVALKQGDNQFGGPVYMLDQLYFGEYVNHQQELFQYITSPVGEIYGFLARSFGSPKDVDVFQIFMYDPEYHDQKGIRIHIELADIINQTTWVSTNASGKIIKRYKQREGQSLQLTGYQYNITLENTAEKDASNVKIKFELKKNSKALFTAKFEFLDRRYSTAMYSLYCTFVVGIQILSAFFLIKKIDTTHPNIIGKLSLTTMTMCNIEDFYLTMFNIENVMTSRSSFYFFYVLPSIGYVILFVIFDMKLLFLAWRSHYMRQIDNPQDLRKKLTTFYIKFYVALFLYLGLEYFFSFDVWMIILQNLIMLPQIIHNVRTGVNPGFQPLYVFGFLGGKFLLPFYERGCAKNHFKLTPMPGLVIALFIIYSIMILILYLQYRFGPRFFIPKNFQPDYYNYNFKIRACEQNKDMECSICLQSFFEVSASTVSGRTVSDSIASTSIITSNNLTNDTNFEQPMIKEKSVMRTPCGHMFHRDCLTSWTDVKLECPSCRAPLPPI